MSTQLSNGLLARRRRVNPVVLNELTLVTSTKSSGGGTSVSCPTTQAGDVLIFISGSNFGGSIPSITPPTGFTETGAAIYGGQYCSTLFHKLATGSEGGTTLTGQTTNPFGCAVLVFRGNVPISGIIVNSMAEQTAGAGSSLSRTIPSGSGLAPLLAFANVARNVRNVSLSPITGRVDVELAAGTGIAGVYDIQNASPTNASLSVTSSASGLTASVSCYYTFTA